MTDLINRLEKAEAELKRLRDAEWSDLSDAEMGRCFKAFAEQVEAQSEKKWRGDAEMRLGLMSMGLQQAIKMAAESDAEAFTYTASGFHTGGVQMGDWQVTVSRVAAQSTTAQPGISALRGNETQTDTRSSGGEG